MHGSRSCVHDQGPESTGVPGKACRDRPPRVLCHDRDFRVATGFGCSMSRHRLGVAIGSGLWAVSRQARTTEHPVPDRRVRLRQRFLCRDRLLKDSYQDRGSCVATGHEVRMARRARDNAWCARDRAQCAHDRPMTVHRAMHYLGSLFMNIVLEQCT